MSEHPRPLVVISRCIDFDSCRYDGQVIRASLREELEPHVDFVPICPELEIGLGVPRDPVRLVRRSGAAHMVQPSTRRDVTAEMESFSRDFLSGLGAADAFILKARSPSCGVRNAKVFHADADDAEFDEGPGLFAAQVVERFPHAAVEDEAGMNDLVLRHHFLAKAFALAGVRTAAAAGVPALIDFHASSRLLLMAHGEPQWRQLGRLLADSPRRPDDEVAREYATRFAATLARPSRSNPEARAALPEPYPAELARASA